jgi:hypothetical protein
VVKNKPEQQKDISESVKEDPDTHWREYFPVLRGDFFTYDDVRVEYWSGYFTSRPFWKGYYRHVESFLRATELLYTWAHVLPQGSSCAVSYETEVEQFEALQNARKMAGLFMHHDGVTGTARSDVVVDYGMKLYNAMQKLREIYPTILSRIVRRPGSCDTDIKLEFTFDELQAKFDHIIERQLVPITTSKRVAVSIFNALARPRTEIVEMLVDTAKITVTDGTGAEIAYQIAPVWTNNARSFHAQRYKIYFRFVIAFSDSD